MAEPLTSSVLPVYLRRDTSDMWSGRNENKLNYQLWQEQKEFAWAQMLYANQYNTDERLAAQGYNTSERIAAQNFNRSEREAAQQFNLDMWNRTNEYNSPEAQAQRLRAAGLNPANILKGAETAGSVQSSPTSVSPSSIGAGSSATPSPGSPIPMSNQYAEIISSADALASTLGKFAQARGFMIDNESRGAQNRAALEKMIAEKEGILKRSKLDESTVERMKHEITGLKIANIRADFAAKHDKIWEDRAVQTFDAQMRAFQDQHEQSALNASMTKLQEQLMKNADARQQVLIKKQIEVFQSQIEKAAHENGFIDAQKMKTLFEKDLVGVQYRRAQSDEEEESLEHERHNEAVNAVRSNVVGRLLDDVLYYTASNLQVPLRGLFKR